MFFRGIIINTAGYKSTRHFPDIYLQIGSQKHGSFSFNLVILHYIVLVKDKILKTQINSCKKIMQGIELVLQSTADFK